MEFLIQTPSSRTGYGGYVILPLKITGIDSSFVVSMNDSERNIFTFTVAFINIAL